MLSSTCLDDDLHIRLGAGSDLDALGTANEPLQKLWILPLPVDHAVACRDAIRTGRQAGGAEARGAVGAHRLDETRPDTPLRAVLRKYDDGDIRQRTLLRIQHGAADLRAA